MQREVNFTAKEPRRKGGSRARKTHRTALDRAGYARRRARVLPLWELAHGMATETGATSAQIARYFKKRPGTVMRWVQNYAGILHDMKNHENHRTKEEVTCG